MGETRRSARKWNARRSRVLSKSFLILKSCFAVGFASILAISFIRRSVSRYTFRDKVVVITGGSRGLGLALAREFAREGARLALLARDQAELARAVASIGDQAIPWPCDMRQPQEIERTISTIARDYGRIDVLVNNAGTILVAPFHVTGKEDFEEAIETHFWGPYHATMAALPYLRRNRESHLVNISSIGGRVAVPHLAPYCASKFALSGFSDSIRSELAQEGIRVTSVSPGLMRTGSHVNASFKGDHAKEFAWFSIGAGLPFLSMEASRAARQIVEATRRGRPELTITFSARILVFAQALAPCGLAHIFRIVNALLPKATGGEGFLPRKGFQSRSALSPSAMTALADQAIGRYNEG